MNPILIAIDDLNRMADDRHAWLSRAAEQIRQWKADEAATQDNDLQEEE